MGYVDVVPEEVREKPCFFRNIGLIHERHVMFWTRIKDRTSLLRRLVFEAAARGNVIQVAPVFLNGVGKEGGFYIIGAARSLQTP